MSVDEELQKLPAFAGDPSTLPDAADILQKKLDLLPAGNLSLEKLVKDLKKEN